jgi:hypothetical protein
MKRHLRIRFTLFFFTTLPANLSAKKILMKKANKLYQMKVYAEAISYYEHVLKKDSTLSEALINVTDCYRLTNISKTGLLNLR